MLALPLKSYAVNPSQLTLDAVGNFAVYAGGSNAVTGTPATTITGDVGLGPNGTQNFGTAFTVNGTYRVDNTANNSQAYSDANFTGGTVVQDLDYVSARVNSVSAYAASLTPTRTISTINGNVTITGNGGYNIISVGTISLAGVHSLTLKGGANDVFVLNVANYAAFYQDGPEAGFAPIILSGVATNHVLFNLLNTSPTTNALNVTGNNLTLFGTFIAPSASMSIASDTIYGGLFAGGTALTLNSGTIIENIFELPEPPSFALVGISCLFGLGLWWRRRHGASD